MDITYASFEPLPPTPSQTLLVELETKNKKEILRRALDALGPIEELKSDYLGTSTFYYSKKGDIVYEVDNHTHQLLKPAPEVEAHIRTLNSL